MCNNQTAPAILATDEKASLGAVVAPKGHSDYGAESWWSHESSALPTQAIALCTAPLLGIKFSSPFNFLVNLVSCWLHYGKVSTEKHICCICY